MNILSLSLLLFFIGSSTILFGQITLSGKVLTEDGGFLPEANIALMTLPDSSVYARQKSDAQGNFAFRVETPGQYALQYSSLGFTPYYGSTLELRPGMHTTVDPVRLYPAEQEIATVMVEGKMPGIRQYADKMVVDVEGSVLSEGNNLLELLEKTPGILSDGKGNFTIQGRAGANVRIDGRDTYVSGAQLASLLRGMQAKDVAKLELMSSPSAREDASGTAGIINIVTKRNKRIGFGGDVFVRGAQSRKTQGALGGGLHYRINRLNMYVNGSAGREESTDSTRIERLFYSNGVLRSTQRQIERQALDPGKYHSLRTGASYEFEDGGILDASFSWLRGRFITRSDVDMDFAQGAGVISSLAHTDNQFDETYNNLTFNVNYVNKYEGEDHFLKINLDYAPHGNDYDNMFETQLMNPAGQSLGTTARTNIQDLSNTTYAGRLDYSRPLGENNKIELGWKGTYFFIDNDVRNDTLQGNNWIYDQGTSNRFQYGQHIEALYLVYTGKRNKLEYQAGVRGEYTFIKSKQVTLDQNARQEYFELFPSAFINYQVHDNHSLRASFSSRIERPGDHDINAFRIYQDAYSYSEGNPHLKPEKSFIGEIGHGFKNKLFTTLSMGYGRDVINWISRVGNLPGENMTRPENIGNYWNYSVSTMYNHRFYAWWTASHYLNGFHNRYSGEIDETSLDSKGSSWSANSKHTLHLAWGLRAEVAGYYNSGITTGARRSDHTYGVDLAAEKKLWNERGMVKLAANGIVRNANPRYTSTYGDLVLHHSAFPDNRKVTLSLSYRFGE